MRVRPFHGVLVSSLLLVFGLCSCSTTLAAKSSYEIIETGIAGSGCWYDDSHFIVVKGQQPAPGQEFEVEGLYFLDPNRPKELRRLDLSPLEPDLQRHIRDVTCQDQMILFHVLSTDKKRNTIYSLKIGQTPTVLVAKREGFILPQAINVRQRYVLGVSNAISETHSPDTEQAIKDCNLASLMDGYRVFCVRHDRGTKRTWPVNNGFVVKYLWDESIRVEKDGRYQSVLNPMTPLKLPDGTELKQGYLLRDLDNQIIQEIPTKRGLYRIGGIKPNPGGNYLYATCSKAGDYNPAKTFHGRMCRLTLDGTQAQWEEVFSLQQEANEWASLHDFDVNDVGDVVVMRRAKRSSPTIWKYDMQRARVEQLPTGQLSQEIGGVGLTPDGHSISYIDRDHLIFVRSRKETP